ncbi:hypothetical protein, partial [Rubrivivax albus]|uniref:hypothetical protein n=1 Tax=Rubrivivax albus TaxID=2499835 RepID=UPI001E2C05C2
FPVVTSPHLPLGVFVGVHLASLVDTIVAVADALLKMGSPDAYREAPAVYPALRGLGAAPLRAA